MESVSCVDSRHIRRKGVNCLILGMGGEERMRAIGQLFDDDMTAMIFLLLS